MINLGSRDQLQARLEQLSREIAATKKKFHARGHRPGGTHMGHLVEIGQRHEKLHQQVGGADEGLWENMKQSWHEDVTGLLDSFAKAVKYEDEEFHQGQG